MNSHEQKELEDYLESLKKIRKTGARRVSHGGKTVEFHSLAELNAAISSAESHLDRAKGSRVRTIKLIRRV